MNNPALQSGNVAVITGGASGIGFAAAKKFAGFGMKICIADLESDQLHNSTRELVQLASHGIDDVLAVVTDVSDVRQVEILKRTAFAHFGQVNVLMNNAGIGGRAGTFSDYEQWQAILNTNLMGVVNGVQVFTQAMLNQKTPGLIINTGSKQGITNPPGNTAYNTSKAAVKALTEGLQHSLRNEPDRQLTAHLLVPGFVYSGMLERFFPEKPAGAWTCEQTIDFMIEKLNAGDFYIICPDNEVAFESDQKRILWSAGDIVYNRPALSRWHPDYELKFAAFLQKTVDPDQ